MKKDILCIYELKKVGVILWKLDKVDLRIRNIRDKRDILLW